jgi:hypothetical protein
MDPLILTVIVGAVLAGFAQALAGFGFGLTATSIWAWTGRLPRITRGGRAADALAGAAGGLMGALGGFTGVVPTLWCALRDYEKDVQRAVIQNFNLAMLIITFGTYMATELRDATCCRCSRSSRPRC